MLPLAASVTGQSLGCGWVVLTVRTAWLPAVGASASAWRRPRPMAATARTSAAQPPITIFLLRSTSFLPLALPAAAHGFVEGDPVFKPVLLQFDQPDLGRDRRTARGFEIEHAGAAGLPILLGGFEVGAVALGTLLQRRFAFGDAVEPHQRLLDFHMTASRTVCR